MTFQAWFSKRSGQNFDSPAVVPFVAAINSRLKSNYNSIIFNELAAIQLTSLCNFFAELSGLATLSQTSSLIK